MSTAVISSGNKIQGSTVAISSKSELHRMLICAAFSNGATRVLCTPVLSKDMEATIACLRALGVEIEAAPGKIRIKKPISHIRTQNEILLDCFESGSTARFFLPYAAMFCENAVITGRGKLPERPMEDLCVCLESHGARFSDHFLPIRVEKCCDRSGSFAISGNVSSQYLTGLLFALPFIDGDIRLTTELKSSGYVDITLDVMNRFGVCVSENKGIYTAQGSYTAPKENMIAFGDWSNAAFFLCGAALSGSVTLNGLDPCSKQPDRAVLDVLHIFGSSVHKDGTTVSVSKNKMLPFTLDAENIPDLVPILAVMACGAVGKTTISNIERLRIKESDRVDAVCKLICGLGGKAEADEKNLYIFGTGSLIGGTIDSFNDHRIAMSAAVASVLCQSPVTIHDCMAVTKSYPDFYKDFSALTQANITINP